MEAAHWELLGLGDEGPSRAAWLLSCSVYTKKAVKNCREEIQYKYNTAYKY